MNRLMQLIHGQDIYAGFDVTPFPFDNQGWGGDHPIFVRLIEHKKPSLIIEVGTWKGQSALTMAAAVKKLGLKAELVCVDSWLGSANHWRHKGDARYFPSLRTQHGFPQLYYQFLSNVIRSEAQHIITPLPMVAATAAEYLQDFKLKADLIYIDASHDYEAVMQDLACFWPLLAQNGIMFGDDYSEGWPGVIRAVHEFAPRVGMQVKSVDTKWWYEPADLSEPEFEDGL